MTLCICGSCLPTVADVAIALDASEGDIESFTRIMRRSFPVFGFMFVIGGAS